MTPSTTNLIPYATATQIVENMTQVRTDVQQAFALLQQAKERLKGCLGDTWYVHLWQRDISDSDLPRTAEKIAQDLERQAWRYVIEKLGMHAYMTEKRQKELQGQLDKGLFPVLTVENMLSTLQGLAGQADTLLQESAKEVWEWLRPSRRTRTGQLKTNKHYRIDKKVIIGYALDHNWSGGGFHLSYYRQANFRALGNVFSLLDGQGAQQYPNDLCTQLEGALKTAQAGEWQETPYLRVKPYHNQNLHVVFTRDDLLAKLNALAGDGSLGEYEA